MIDYSYHGMSGRRLISIENCVEMAKCHIEEYVRSNSERLIPVAEGEVKDAEETGIECKKKEGSRSEKETFGEKKRISISDKHRK